MPHEPLGLDTAGTMKPPAISG